MTNTLCICGCDKPTAGGRFLPGHDSKLAVRIRAEKDGRKRNALVRKAGWEWKDGALIKTRQAPTPRRPAKASSLAAGPTLADLAQVYKIDPSDGGPSIFEILGIPKASMTKPLNDTDAQRFRNALTEFASRRDRANGDF